MRQIVLDTETTGLDPKAGHRIIEIGGVELIDRQLTNNNYHQYINPQREIDAGATEIHGIRDEDVRDKPLFRDIAEDFLDYIKGAELIIHNAPFDVGFMDMEFAMWQDGIAPVAELCRITDTLEMARQMRPGQRNSLDALCQVYGVDNSNRTLHGALLDAEILADVYLRMTGGQGDLLAVSGADGEQQGKAHWEVTRLDSNRPALKIIAASDAELLLHQQRLEAIAKASDGKCLWLTEEKPN